MPQQDEAGDSDGFFTHRSAKDKGGSKGTDDAWMKRSSLERKNTKGSDVAASPNRNPELYSRLKEQNALKKQNYNTITNQHHHAGVQLHNKVGFDSNSNGAQTARIDPERNPHKRSSSDKHFRKKSFPVHANHH